MYNNITCFCNFFYFEIFDLDSKFISLKELFIEKYGDITKLRKEKVLPQYLLKLNNLIKKSLTNEEEKTFEIDLQENHTYESFLKKINEEFKRTNTYQLMAMNSSEQCAILNSDNFLQILNEDIQEYDLSFKIIVIIRAH